MLLLIKHDTSYCKTQSMWIYQSDNIDWACQETSIFLYTFVNLKKVFFLLYRKSYAQYSCEDNDMGVKKRAYRKTQWGPLGLLT